MAAATCLGLPLNIAMGNAGRTVDRCAFGWASHKIHALHKLNRRRRHQLRMAEEIDREQEIDENPAILYSLGQGGVGTE